MKRVFGLIFRWIAFGGFNKISNLILAVSSNRKEDVEALIRAKVNVNCRDRSGKVALMEAVNQENIEIVRLLIKSGADVNIQNKYGVTALMGAIKHGRLEIVRLLIEARADVNIQDECGMTALMRATVRGPVEIVRLLVEAGAKVNIQNQLGGTALMMTTVNRQPDIALLLIKSGADINIQDKDGMTPLMRGIIHKQVEIVRLLIEAGANLSIRNNAKKTVMDMLETTSDPNHLQIKEMIEEKLKEKAFSQISDMSYEELVDPLKSNEVFENLKKLGILGKVMESKGIDSYEKLKEVYQQLSTYVQQDTMIKRQLQSAFIQKRSLLMDQKRTFDSYERERG